MLATVACAMMAAREVVGLHEVANDEGALVTLPRDEERRAVGDLAGLETTRKEDHGVDGKTFVILHHVQEVRTMLSERVTAHGVAQDKLHSDLESRMREVEKFNARIFGALVLVGATAGLIGGLVSKLLK
jgi:hypothetical protein